MVISYRDKTFDTGRNIEIRYADDDDMRALVGYIIDSTRERRILPSSIGIVSRFYPFISNLSILENIILPLEYHEHMSAGEAAGKVAPHVQAFGLDRVATLRKEKIRNTDLFKAMFLRAMAMDPDVVFICDFKYSVTLREFQGMIDLFGETAGDRTNIWLGVSEEHHVTWDHDLEVTLGD
jgi:ABC-type lipoprotein export system ATPase subunit